MTEIREISVVDSLEQAAGLLAEHYDELAKNKRVMKLEPARELYAALESAGLLFGLGVFDGDLMVGYSVCTIGPHMHYRSLTYCTNDVLFLRKKYRAGRLGLQLIRRTEALAKERGAQLMLWHAKPDTALDAMLPRLEYGVQDVIFSRELR